MFVYCILFVYIVLYLYLVLYLFIENLKIFINPLWNVCGQDVI